MVIIRWTKESVFWLKEIYEYIYKDNPKLAKEVVLEIYKIAQSLKRFPERGYRYDRFPDRNIRILLYGHYRIAYLIKPGCVDILGIFHGSLNIDRYLKRPRHENN